MAKTINYSPGRNTNMNLFLQGSQQSLFSPKALKQAKIKKEKLPPPPILLKTFIPFGQYKGMLIENILNNESFITWWSKKSKRPIAPEVTEAIKQLKYLSQ